MKSLSGLEKRLEELAEWARPPDPQDETRRWLESYRDFLKAAEMEDASSAYLAFLAELEYDDKP